MVVLPEVCIALEVGLGGGDRPYYSVLGCGGEGEEQEWSNLMPGFLAQATQWSVHTKRVRSQEEEERVCGTDNGFRC